MKDELTILVSAYDDFSFGKESYKTVNTHLTILHRLFDGIYFTIIYNYKESSIRFGFENRGE